MIIPWLARSQGSSSRWPKTAPWRRSKGVLSTGAISPVGMFPSPVGGVAVGAQGQLVVRNRPAIVPRQVEIGVVGEIHQRVSVRDSLVVDDQRTALQAVCDLRPQRAGITLLPSGDSRKKVTPLSRAGVAPELLVEARQPAVEMIAPLVGAAELLTAQAEAGAADPVGTPADGAPRQASRVS